MVQTHILELLRCPRTGQQLRLASSEETRQLHAFGAEAEGWLATNDGRLFYPVRGGIPILLDEEARALES